MILGVDISKNKFDVALILDDKIKTKQFPNNDNGFSDLVDWLKGKGVQTLHVCMEATGNYGEALATHIFDLGYKVSIINPAQIKGFGQSELSRTKSDKADAQLIARFCKAMQPKAWQPKPEHIRTLQSWVRRLEVLQDMNQQERNRLDVSAADIKVSIEAVIEKLAEEIKKVKAHIRDHIDQYPDLSAKKKLLETIPGVGTATIRQILAFIGNAEDFQNAKQLSAFIGLNPKQRQSGSSVRGRTRLSKTGDARLRKAFYMPAIVSKQYNPIIKAFCQRLKSAGKSPMQIIGAAMRKLVHLIYVILRSGKPFDPSLAI